MTDSKTPEWADVAARALDAMPPEGPQLRNHRIAFISQALLSAYERGRAEGIEGAAKLVEKFPDTVALPEEDVERFGMFARQANRTDLSTAIRQLLEVKG